MSVQENIDSLELNWYVIYTKSRHEKIVSARLNEIGIECYCPVKIERKQWADRKKNIEKPLFNSYCFVKISKNNFREVFKVSGVVNYIYWCGKPAIVKTVEIETIKKWLNDFDHNEIEVCYFKKNDQVLIQSGNFMNHSAKIINANRNHLILELNDLGLRLMVKKSDISLEKAV